MTAVVADDDCAATVELIERSITLGDGTDYAWDSSGGDPLQGFGVPDVRNNDVDKGHGDGATGQHDFYQTRVLTMAVSIAPAPGESTVLTTAKPALWARWETLKAAWAKTPDGTDLTLEYIDSGTVMTYRGRPAGAVLDQSFWRRGIPALRVLLTFRCPDPTEY